MAVTAFAITPCLDGRTFIWKVGERCSGARHHDYREILEWSRENGFMTFQEQFMVEAVIVCANDDDEVLFRMTWL